MKDMKKEIKKIVQIDELAEFKQKLEKLLLKYPNLPEFTLKIQPRIDIKVTTPFTYGGTVGLSGTAQINVPYIPTIISQTEPTPGSTTGTTVHISKNLEASITKGRIEELAKSAKSE